GGNREPPVPRPRPRTRSDLGRQGKATPRPSALASRCPDLPLRPVINRIRTRRRPRPEGCRSGNPDVSDRRPGVRGILPPSHLAREGLGERGRRPGLAREEPLTRALSRKGRGGKVLRLPCGGVTGSGG